MTSTGTTLTLSNVSDFQSSSSRELTPVLRLRGSASSSSTRARPTVGQKERARHIKWDEKVINNEGMGKKKSKICCIYHAPRPFDESSDESSSCSSDSEGESINDDENCYYSKSSSSCNSSLNDVKDKVTLSSSKTISTTTQLPEENSREAKNNQDEEEEKLIDDTCCNHHNLDKIGKRRKYGKHKKTNGSPNAYERLSKPR